MHSLQTGCLLMHFLAPAKIGYKRLGLHHMSCMELFRFVSVFHILQIFRFTLLFGGLSKLGLHTVIFKKTHYSSLMVHCCSTPFHTECSDRVRHLVSVQSGEGCTCIRYLKGRV